MADFICMDHLDTRYFGKTEDGKIGVKYPSNCNVCKYAKKHTFIANTPLTINYGLNTEDIIVQVYTLDRVLVSSEAKIQSANTVDITVTDDWEFYIVIIG